MKFNQKAIEKLRNGEIQLHDEKECRIVKLILEEAFPKMELKSTGTNYYYLDENNNNEWSISTRDIKHLPIYSTKEFLLPELKLVTDLGENEVIHCPTEREAQEICRLMHEAGLKWRDSDSYLEETKWHVYKEKNCYRPKTGSYADTIEYQNKVIYKASEFINPEFYQNNNMQTIKKTDLKQIWEVACASWKTKIADMAKQDPFSDTVELTDTQMEEMFKAADEAQTKVLEKFLKREEIFDSSKLKVGEMMEVTETGNKGAIVLRTWSELVNLKSPASTWETNAILIGKKLPSGTKIEVIAK